MQAGRELDALVAEKVMGWTVRHFEGVNFPGSAEPFIPKFLCDSTGVKKCRDIDFRPSTDIAAAWKVVEKLQANEYEVVGQFESSRATISSNDQTWSVMPACIAGVTRSV